MSDTDKSRGHGIVGSYLKFLDKNILFKKPISCFYALFSMLIPLAFLFLIIRYRDFIFENTRLFLACILTLAVLSIAGIFGALIWWHRRINNDEGPKCHVNLRRFIQTLGEWTGTLFAIIVFGCICVILLVLTDAYDYISLLMVLFPIPLPEISIYLAIYGLIGGFFIMIATKVILFLYDLLIWLGSRLWRLLVRIVQYYYRCIIKIHRTLELNTSVWIGVVWLFAAVAVFIGLILCFKLVGTDFRAYLLGLIPLGLGLGFMAFLVINRKNYDM